MDIAHVVVLMLENRSFDCMLGALYPDRLDFDGLDGSQSNVWHKPDGTREKVPVWNDPDLTAGTVVVPDPDPGELFADINMQIHGIDADPTPMGGFVDNYMRQAAADKPFDPRAVMHYFTPDQVPVISLLARSFGVCDRWFASAPNQTWPNRFFAHTGTANGYVNNNPPHFPYDMDTVFNGLSDVGQSWNIYFHDFPQTAALANLWLHAGHYRHFGDSFVQDAAAGRLPAYSFIEPRYFVDPVTGQLPNDEHPPHNIVLGEQLVATIYNALRGGPGWEKTLFVITCDEHGGCYDHVVPPAATPPGGPYSDGFTFDRFGVRVPSVIVSPHVAVGSILRAPGQVPFDHTSIIATLRALFGIGPLTARDAAAPSILDVLDPLVVNNGPDSIAAPPAPRPDLAVAAAVAARKPNGLQASLSAAARALPPFGADLAAHLKSLTDTGVDELAHPDAASAFAGVPDRLRSFLARA